ncbi:MAG: RCC1 domain-containing protein, partial [Roseiflexaceae bacterium]
NGTLATWGKNTLLQAQFHINVQPESLFFNGPYIDVATGVESSYAIDVNGDLYAWGGNIFTELDAPNAAWSNVKAVGSGAHTACVVKEADVVDGITYTEGSVVCWGDDSNGQLATKPGGLTGVTAVDGGNHHLVALKSDGTVVSWGFTGGHIFGCMGQPSPADVPVDYTNGSHTVIQASAGEDHTLVLLADGTVDGWGCNDQNQINIPLGATNVVSIAAGRKVSIAARADGSVIAWGQTEYRNFTAAGLAAPPGGTHIQTFPAAVDAVLVDSYAQNSIIAKRDGRVLVGGHVGAGFFGVEVSRTHTRTATKTATPTP